LITAAAGGVGHFAVQLAKRLGAHVVATASRRSRAFVHALGADTVIDYTAEDVIEGVLNRFPEGVHKALNGVSGDMANKVARAVRKGGKVVDLTGSASVKVPGVQIITDYGVEANADGLARLARMIDEGRLHVRTQEVFPFDDAPLALERAAAGHVHGKLALEIA
ncbi:MAG: zinc-binding dehydrogenase, partial [Polyangiaceae bacterium]